MDSEIPPVYIISGGVGASGEQLVHTVLAQFPGRQVPVLTFGNIRQAEQIESILQQARQMHAILVHTLVDTHLRSLLVARAAQHNLLAIDLMGPLLEALEGALEQAPAEQPGLYRKLRQDYYERVGAIDFAMAHDDAKNPAGWSQAEIVIAGVSRTGKTPLSLYLSVLGWKVANVPIIMGIEPPAELFRLDPRRVVGLTIEPGQLLLHRQQRQRRIGAPGRTAYTDPQAIYEEVERALNLFKRSGFHTINVTDKPIETSADEIIRLMSTSNRP